MISKRMRKALAAAAVIAVVSIAGIDAAGASWVWIVDRNTKEVCARGQNDDGNSGTQIIFVDACMN